MRRLKLDLTIQQATSVDDAIEDSKRLNHRRLILRSTNEEQVSRATKSKLLEITDNSFIEDLSLIFLPLSLQNSILSSLSHITTLYVDSLYVHPSYHATIDFPNLKEVDCVRSDFILNNIGRHRIEKLKISYIQPEIYVFLERCNGLKELSMWGFRARYDRQFNNFQLEALKLAADPFDDASYQGVNWNLQSCLKFLESQRRSLKKLHIAYTRSEDWDEPDWSCEEIVIYALNKMDLRVLRAYYPVETGTVVKLNEQMKDLKINFDITEVTENIIACCPNVEKIELWNNTADYQKILPFISTHMPYLKHLKINFILPHGKIEKFNAHFPNLEILDVALWDERDIRDLITLLKCCPNVKYLKIDTPVNFQWHFLDLIDFLELIPNVEEILTFGDFGLVDVTMQLITECRNALKLKYLKFMVERPANFSRLIEKYSHSKINFMAMQSQTF
jgi:hypothetical protein